MAANRQLVQQYRKLEARLGRHRGDVQQCMQRITDALHVRTTMGEAPTIDFVVAQATQAIEQLRMMQDLCGNFAVECLGRPKSPAEKPATQPAGDDRAAAE